MVLNKNWKCSECGRGESASEAGAGQAAVEQAAGVRGVEDIMVLVDAVCDATMDAFGCERKNIGFAEGLVAKLQRETLREALRQALKSANAEVSR